MIDSLSFSFVINNPGTKIKTESLFTLNEGLEMTIVSNAKQYSIEKIEVLGENVETLVLEAEIKIIIEDIKGNREKQVQKSSRKLYYAKGIGLVKKVIDVGGKITEQYLESILSVDEFEKE